MKRIRKGDRVILTQAVCSPCLTIPIWGSHHQSVGTAANGAIGESSHVTIEWDNGETSAFFLYKLKLHGAKEEEKDPNIAFLHRKMRSRNG